jgi:Helix-turn-helix domain
MSYRQITPGERYMLAALRRQGLNQSQIARSLGRHRSTIGRAARVPAAQRRLPRGVGRSLRPELLITLGRVPGGQQTGRLLDFDGLDQYALLPVG